MHSGTMPIYLYECIVSSCEGPREEGLLSKRQSRSKPVRKTGHDTVKTDKFRRESAADRRRHLGEAVLRCILKSGSAGISVRQIAAEAGVSLGLIRYHFGQFDDLIAYAFDMTTDTFFHAIGE